MPRGKAIKSKSHKIKTHKPITNDISNRLANLLNTISNNRSTMTKSEINLPARLLQNGNRLSNQNSNPLMFSKSISSSYSSSMHNGEVHTTGKEVVNDSTNPYIQVAELHNGQVEHYMIPRNQSSQSSHSKLLNQSTNTRHTIKKTKKTKKTKKPKKTKKTNKTKKLKKTKKTRKL